MQRPNRISTLLLATALGACAGAPSWDNDEALAAESIEMRMDPDGIIEEVEYHHPASVVPEEVIDAMNQLHPSGVAIGAEREYAWSTPYWEVVKDVDGRKVEAMFRPDGKLHSEEIEIAQADVPEKVVKKARKRFGDGPLTWEVIHNHKQKVVGYHAKGTGTDGKNYKLQLSKDGELKAVYREVVAEIEVLVLD